MVKAKQNVKQKIRKARATSKKTKKQRVIKKKAIINPRRPK